MTEIDNLRIALNLSGIGINNQLCDLILETQKKVKILKGKFSVEDGVKLQCENVEKYNPKTKEKVKKY
mgnify:CR=1 FL=1